MLKYGCYCHIVVLCAEFYQSEDSVVDHIHIIGVEAF
jgi:hypothetical protein